MPSYAPISNTLPQYCDNNGDPYSGAVLKAYEAGTSTVLQMATDSSGGTLVNDIVLNSAGYPEVSGNEVIPHVSEAYKLMLYPTEAAADANSGQIWSIDNLSATLVVYDDELTLDGDFTIGVAQLTVLDTLEGYLCTLTLSGGVTHSSTWSPSTSSGFIPSAYRAAAENVIDINANRVCALSLSASGAVSLLYRDWAGAESAQAALSGVHSITWFV